MINKSWCAENLHLALGKRCKVGQPGTSIALSAAHCYRCPMQILQIAIENQNGCGDKIGYLKNWMVHTEIDKWALGGSKFRPNTNRHVQNWGLRLKPNGFSSFSEVKCP